MFKLEKPYTDKDRFNFIIEHNAQNGRYIYEKDNCIYALEPNEIVKEGEVVINPNYETEQLANAKEQKIAENDKKATETRYSQEFTLTIQEQECLFDTTEQTQRDLLTAFAVCSTGEPYNGWVTNNGVELDLTLQDVAMISSVFKEKSDVYGKWNEYKTAIDEAKTLEELEAIDIDYDEMDNK